MPFDLYQHYKALYDAAQPANASLPLVPVFTGNDLSGISIQPPFITYKQESENPFGTTGGGAMKVIRSSWLFIAYDQDLEGALDATSNLINTLTDMTITTVDGYTTTASELFATYPLYEQDHEANASYLRWMWERSN